MEEDQVLEVAIHFKNYQEKTRRTKKERGESGIKNWHSFLKIIREDKKNRGKKKRKYH